jgi:hypothetical protein
MKRTVTLKSMLAVLTAVVGIALGATTMIGTAHASNVHLNPPSDLGT